MQPGHQEWKNTGDGLDHAGDGVAASISIQTDKGSALSYSDIRVAVHAYARFCLDVLASEPPLGRGLPIPDWKSTLTEPLWAELGRA